MPAIHFQVAISLNPFQAWKRVFSHLVLGAFGSGAAFALEDAWVLAQALRHTRSQNRPPADALRIFDDIRSPYYLRMYEHLDQQKKKIEEAKASAANRSFEDVLGARVSSFGGDKLAWIYMTDIEEVWNEYLNNEEMNSI